MLLDKLTQKQKDLKESDQVFAKRLGIHRTTWMHTRNKRLRIGSSIIGGALKAFPELKEDVIFFLNTNDSKRYKNDTLLSKAS